MIDELGCLDGEIRPAEETFIPATDEGLLRGDGVFEVVRVYRGRPFALGEHLDRMARSADNLRLGWEVPRAELERDVGHLLEARGPDFSGLVRLVLTRGERRLVLTEPLPAGPERVRLGFVTYAPSRVLDGVKSLSYAANMLCTRLAKERGFDEALLVTPHGRVLEAPTSSLFWVDERGVLSTPPLDEHILASITRDRLLQLLEVDERPVSSDDLLEQVREAFIASTTREVQSVSAIEGTELPDVGEVTRKAAGVLRGQIEAELS
jgi:branched-chain amino acid aminotransferase